MDASHTQAPRPQPVRGFSFALLAAALLVGCAVQPPAEPAPTPANLAAWPRTLTDDEGTTIELAEPPERVISLSPANTEIAFALGAGDRLVGGTDFDDYPSEAAALPDVATFTGVLLEQAVALEPDLVLAAGNNFTPPDDIERMRELGLTVLVVYAETVDEVLSDIALVGQALGADEQAADILSGMQARLAEVQAAVESVPERPRVFYQIGSVPEIYAPAPDSFIADMVALGGGEPITTTDPAVFSISVERLVELDPEVIVLGDAAYGVCPAEVRTRPGWESMTAVQADALRPVDDVIITRPGPRLAEGLAALALAIHPTLDLQPPTDGAVLCAEGSLAR